MQLLAKQLCNRDESDDYITLSNRKAAKQLCNRDESDDYIILSNRKASSDLRHTLIT